MANELYFLPILFRALENQNLKEALLEAFATIQDLGQKPEYQEGYLQFQLFMGAVKAQAVSPEKVESPIYPSMYDWITNDPIWLEDFRHWLNDYEASLDTLSYPEIQLFRAEKLLGNLSLSPNQPIGIFTHINPGQYTIKFETGWVIWEDQLSDRDLIWSHAFPGRPLDLAADTGEGHREPSQEILLLDGEIMIRVLPGIETGSLEIQLRKPEDSTLLL